MTRRHFNSINTSETDVLIVGAGPTGLTLACELARRGVRFRLIEARDGPIMDSRAKSLQPRTLEVFEDLGIIDAVLKSGRLNLPLRLYDSHGRHHDRYIHDDYRPTPSAPYAAMVFIPQFRVEAILRNRLQRLGAAVEFGKRLMKLEQKEDGVVATVSTVAGKELIAAAWLVGCDGAHSVTRNLMRVKFLGQTNDNARLVIGDFKVSGLDRRHWHVWRGANLCPLPGTNIWQVQAVIKPDHDAELSVTTFQQLIDAVTGRQTIRLSDPTWMTRWRLNERLAERYRVGRVFLAGDAAHTHSPAGGQGMNTGIQDAYNLGWKLAAVVEGVDRSLLDTYEEERLPMGEWAIHVSSGLWRRIYGKRAFDHPKATQQLWLKYRNCKLATDLRNKPHLIYAGDRAPDAPELVTRTGKQRMFDLFRGTHVTVLAFGRRWDGVMKRINSTYGNRVKCVVIGHGLPSEAGLNVWDSDGHASRSYDADASTGALFIIRPDGYIGLATERLAKTAIFDYLRALMPRATVVTT